MSETEALHLYLLEWRKLRGYTQQDLAEATGFDAGYISKVERGKRDGLSQKFLTAAARALKCRPKDLFEDPTGDVDLDLLAIIKLWGEMPDVSRKAARAMLRGLADSDTEFVRDEEPQQRKKKAS